MSENPSLDGFQKRRINQIRDYYSISPQSPIYAPDDLQNPEFNLGVYLEKEFACKSFEELLENNTSMKKEMKKLDVKLQGLVYTNYSKFIKSSDTIKKMKNDVETISSEMENLNDKFLEIVQSSRDINSHLSVKRNEIKRLYKISEMLEKLHFILDLPKTLKRCLQKKYYSLCVKYYRITERVLSKHNDLFQGISASVTEIIGEVKRELREAVFDLSRKKYVRCKEYFMLLMELDVDKVALGEEFCARVVEMVNQILDTHPEKVVGGDLYENLNGLFRKYHFHFANFVDVYLETFFTEKESIRFVTTIQNILVPYIAKCRRIIEANSKAEGSGSHPHDTTVEGGGEPVSQTKFLDFEKNEEMLRGFKLLFMQLKTLSADFEECQSSSAQSEIITFIYDRTCDMIAFVLKDIVLMKNLTRIKQLISGEIYRISSYSVASAAERRKRRRQSFSVLHSSLESYKEIRSEGQNLSNMVTQLIEEYTSIYKKFLGVLQNEKQILIMIKFVHTWIEMNCSLIIEHILTELPKRCPVYSIIPRFISGDEEEEEEEEIKNEKCSAVGALIFHHFCHLMTDHSLSTIENIIDQRFERSTPLFDHEKLNFRLYDMSKYLVRFYVELQGDKIGRFIKHGVATVPGRWKEVEEPRRVSQYAQITVEEMKEISECLEAVFQEDSSGDSESDASSFGRNSSLRHYSTLTYGKDYNTKLDLDAKLLEDEKLAQKTHEIFVVDVHDVAKTALQYQIIKIWTKTFDECVRSCHVFNTFGYQQMQVDISYVNAKLKELAPNVEYLSLLNEILKSVAERTKERKRIAQIILDSIIKEVK